MSRSTHWVFIAAIACAVLGAALQMFVAVACLLGSAAHACT